MNTTSVRRTIRAGLVAATAAVAALSTVGSASAATFTPFFRPSYDHQLVAYINSARAAHNLPALTAVAGTTDVAHRWSCQMAAADNLSHDPLLVSRIASHGSASWHFIAENVGYHSAPDPKALFTAYMNSPHHRENILDPRAHFIGSFTRYAHGVRWNTLDFVDSYTNAYGGSRTSC